MGYIHNVQGKDHTVTDKDGQHFVIDAITRQITNNTGKVVLTKLDHNSECFTFEIPGEIEGHDMSDCNVVEVHYINIDSSTRAQNADVYTVEDFTVNEEEKKGTFSWLVSRSATQYAGTLNFAVHFACYPESEDGVDKSSTPLYSWRTGVFSGITIINSVFSAEQAISDYSDILQSWWNKIASTHEDVYMITDDGFILNLTDSMENLTGRVGTLETEVSGLKTADTTMAGRVGTLETEVSGLKTADTTMAGRVGTLETDVAGLKNTCTTLYLHTISLYGSDEETSSTREGNLFIVTNGATPFTVQFNNSSRNYEIVIGEDGTFILGARWCNFRTESIYHLLLNTNTTDWSPNLMNVGYISESGEFRCVTLSDCLNSNSIDTVTKL